MSVHETGSLGDLLVELTDEQAVRTLAPDLAAIERLAPRGLIVTAPAIDPASAHDFVCRVFDPAAGIPEDPVTGSAHTVLAPFWSRRLGADALIGLQVSARTGTVHTVLRGDRVLLAGTAVTVIDGTLHVQP